MTGPDADDLARQARTLAQAHPLSPLAGQFVNRSVAEQSANQPSPEIGTWAGACLTNGYCLRRVEENEAGLVLQVQADVPVDVDALGTEAARIATALRTPDSDSHFLIEEDRVIGALDRIISSEVGRRLDNLRTAIDKEAAIEVEEFLTWWTVQGYALRAAEQSSGVLA
ncbi:MAG TPA: hypothetical protein VHM89_02585 [Acidimicrobiales bacterium]|nr:hypothetical protein [Acidimicrobiales bacterium]